MVPLEVLVGTTTKNEIKENGQVGVRLHYISPSNLRSLLLLSSLQLRDLCPYASE